MFANFTQYLPTAMQRLTIQIPEGNVDSLKNTLAKLGGVVEQETFMPNLSPHQQELLLEAMSHIKDSPERFTDWDIARQTLKFA